VDKVYTTMAVADKLDTALQEFLDYGRTKNLSPHTIGYYRDRLRLFFGYCRDTQHINEPNLVTVVSARGFITYAMDKGYSIKTINHTMTAVKALYNYLMDEGTIPISPVARIKPLKTEHKMIHAFGDKDIEDMLRQCNRKTFVGLRDYTILLTLIDTGLRVSELCGLEAGDIDWSSGFMRVLGKGSKERQVPFGMTLRRALRDYVNRKGHVGGDHRLFVNQFAQPLDRRLVRLILVKLGQKAGVTGVRVSPHTCRHTFAKNWILNGGDPFSLQRILGHTTQEMVSQYVNLATEDIRVQHSKFSPGDRLAQATTGRRVILR